MGVHVYSYNDPGSPGHPNATRGSMAALLRKCLVTGYSLGAAVTPSAGWEEIFTELNNYTAFRSLLGLGRQIYQIDDNQADTDVAYIRAGESLAQVDGAMVGQWGEDYFGKMYSAGTAGPWWVIADEKTCYVILTSAYGLVIEGFGEFDSFVPEDPYNSFVSGHQTTNALAYTDQVIGLHYGGYIGSSDTGLEFHRSCNGTFAPNGGLISAYGISSTLGYHGAVSSASSANTGLGYPVSPCFVSSLTTFEGGNKLIRGKLRGMYQPLAYRPLENEGTFVDPVTGKTMMQINICSQSGYEGAVFFDITGPW